MKKVDSLSGEMEELAALHIKEMKAKDGEMVLSEKKVRKMEAQVRNKEGMKRAWKQEVSGKDEEIAKKDDLEIGKDVQERQLVEASAWILTAINFWQCQC